MAIVNALTITTDILQELSVMWNNQDSSLLQTHQIVFEPFDRFTIQVIGRFICKEGIWLKMLSQFTCNKDAHKNQAITNNNYTTYYSPNNKISASIKTALTNISNFICDSPSQFANGTPNHGFGQFQARILILPLLMAFIRAFSVDE